MRSLNEAVSPARVAGLSLALALALALALPAAAQTEPPINLLPPQAPQGAPAPQPEPPSHGLGGEAGITTTPLAPADTSWNGPLTAAQGGFPAGLWQGTSRALLTALLPHLAPTDSPVLQDLSRRLLLSNALAPAGSDAPDHPSLAALRLDRLLALGLVARAQPLLDQPAGAASSDTIDRDRIQLRFAANDTPGACRIVQEQMPHRQGVWWDRALIACQALSGAGAKASLGLGLLAEQKAPADPVFDQLITVLTGEKHRIAALPDPTPLRIALLASTKQPLPAQALAEAGPAALYEYATDDALPVEQRLAAAERAARLGALAPEALGKLYGAAPVLPEATAALLAHGTLPDTPRDRALLYGRASAQGTDPATRAKALALLLAAAHKQNSFLLMARLAAPLLLDLPAGNEPPGFAAGAARALIATGHGDKAGLWLAAAGEPALLAVERLARPPATPGGADLRKTISALSARDAATAARSNLLLGLTAAFEPVDGAELPELIAAPHSALVPSALLWVDQSQAATAKRLGETLLTTLLLVQADGHLSTEPIVLGRAIAGLRAVGLDKAARAMAVEAAIDGGL